MGPITVFITRGSAAAAVFMCESAGNQFLIREVCGPSSTGPNGGVRGIRDGVSVELLDCFVTVPDSNAETTAAMKQAL